MILALTGVSWPRGRGITRWMGEWADRTNAWSQYLIGLGDFNIDRKDDPFWQALISTGLTVPEDLDAVPRSIFTDPGKPTAGRHYDQIAWLETTRGCPQLSLDYRRTGHVDFLPFAYTDTGRSRSEISYQVFDHYPLWVEFGLAPG